MIASIGSVFTCSSEPFPEALQDQLKSVTHRLHTNEDGTRSLIECEEELQVSRDDFNASRLKAEHLPAQHGREYFGWSAALEHCTAQSTCGVDFQHLTQNDVEPSAQYADDPIATAIARSARTILAYGPRITVDTAIYAILRCFRLYRLLVFVRSRNEQESLAATLRSVGCNVLIVHPGNTAEELVEFDVAIQIDLAYCRRTVLRKADIVCVTHPDSLSKYTTIDLLDASHAKVVVLTSDAERRSPNERDRFRKQWGSNRVLLLDVQSHARRIQHFEVEIPHKLKFVSEGRRKEFGRTRSLVYRNRTVQNRLRTAISRLIGDAGPLRETFKGVPSNFEKASGLIYIVTAGEEQLRGLAELRKNLPIVIDNPDEWSGQRVQFKGRCYPTSTVLSKLEKHGPVFMTTLSSLPQCPPAAVYIDVAGTTGRLRLSHKHRVNSDDAGPDAAIFSVKFSHYPAGIEAHRLKMRDYAAANMLAGDDQEVDVKGGYTQRSIRTSYDTTPWRQSKFRRRAPANPLDPSGRPASGGRFADEVAPALDAFEQADVFETLCAITSNRHGPSPGPDGVSPRELDQSQYSAMAQGIVALFDQKCSPPFRPSERRLIEIPKGDPSRGFRTLAIGNVTDRIVESVIYNALMARVNAWDSLGSNAYCVSSRGGRSLIVDLFRAYNESGGMRHFLCLGDLVAAYDNVPVNKAIDALRRLSAFDEVRKANGHFPTGVERLFRLVKKFASNNDSRSRGIDQGSPLSMLLLDALLLNVHDRPLSELIESRFLFRYVDNGVYLCSDGKLGHRALKEASSRLEKVGMPFKTTGKDYGVFDLHDPKGDLPALLGFRLRADGVVLKAYLPHGWKADLESNIMNAFGSGNPVETARGVVKQWISYFSLCDSEAEIALNGITSALKNCGFHELTFPSVRTLFLKQWERSTDRWKEAIDCSKDALPLVGV